MEKSIIENTNQTQAYRLEFFGIGTDYFAILIVNWLLTLLTLGLYYPWARAKRLRYVYGQTALNKERFHFAGTGKEMFIGLIIVILFYIAIMAISSLLVNVVKAPLLATLFLYLAFFAIIPFAIHGSFRYRMSRTSYRGIRFGYRGARNEFVKNFFLWALLTIVTFGIYGAWLRMNVRNYTHKNIRYGDVAFFNNCDGGDWFVLNLKGYFLTLFTFGIYFFWWQNKKFNYYINNMKMTKGEQKIIFKSTATGSDFFALLVCNFLIILLTFGLGKAWADMRTQKFICDNIKMEGNISINEINQTEEEYKNAIGEDTMEFFEIEIG